MFLFRAITIVSALALLIVSSGCFSTRVLNIKNGMASTLSKEYPVAAHSGLKAEAVRITIVGPNCMGCYLKRTQSPSGNFIGSCDAISLINKDSKDILRSLNETDAASLDLGLIFQDFNAQLKKALEVNLSRNFVNVNVELKETASTSDMTLKPNLHFQYNAWSKFAGQEAAVTLVAISADGKTRIEGNAKAINKVSTSFLSYGIPVGIITFPVGTCVMALSLETMFTKAGTQAVSDALYRASADLANKMAAQAHVVKASDWIINMAMQ